MADIEVRQEWIEVRSTRGEKLAALRGDLSLPRTSVLGVETARTSSSHAAASQLYGSA